MTTRRVHYHFELFVMILPLSRSLILSVLISQIYFKVQSYQFNRLIMSSDYGRTLIVGLNPALQRTITVPNLKLGHVNRGTSVEVGIGGKGQNVIVASSCLPLRQRPTLLQLLGNGFEGDSVAHLLSPLTDSLISIRYEASCRVCVTLLNGDESTEIIEPSGCWHPASKGGRAAGQVGRGILIHQALEHLHNGIFTKAMSFGPILVNTEESRLPR